MDTPLGWIRRAPCLRAEQPYPCPLGLLPERHAGSLISRSSNNHVPQSAHTSAAASSIVVTACRVRVLSFPPQVSRRHCSQNVGAADRLRVAPSAAPCKRPILGHGSFRISNQVQAASNRLLFDCHRWRYDTQFCETAKQDGFGRGFGPETGPLESVSSNARFLRHHGDAAGGTRSVD